MLALSLVMAALFLGCGASWCPESRHPSMAWQLRFKDGKGDRTVAPSVPLDTWSVVTDGEITILMPAECGMAEAHGHHGDQIWMSHWRRRERVSVTIHRGFEFELFGLPPGFPRRRAADTFEVIRSIEERVNVDTRPIYVREFAPDEYTPRFTAATTWIPDGYVVVISDGSIRDQPDDFWIALATVTWE